MNLSQTMPFNEISLPLWENSIESLAKAGRLTACLKIEDGVDHPSSFVCGNNFGSFLKDHGLLAKGSPLLDCEEELFGKACRSGHLESAIVFDCIRIAVFPLTLKGKVVARIVYGFAIDHFVTPAECVHLQKKLNVPYNSLWKSLRSDAPLGEQRFQSVGSLAQNLAIQIMDQISLKYELERALIIKDDFIASVTHELRTPMQSIMLHLDLLETDPHFNSQEIDLIPMRRQLDHLDRLIHQLFDFAKANRGKLEIKKQDIYLNKTLEEILLPFSRIANSEKKTLEIILDFSKNLRGHCDRMRFEQVINNIVGNSLKFTKAGDNITVEAYKEANDFVVKVMDTGKGVGIDFLPQVLGEFTQESTSPDELNSGLGLGLSICQKILELHNGKLSFESEGIGFGTTVTTRWDIL